MDGCVLQVVEGPGGKPVDVICAKLGFEEGRLDRERELCNTPYVVGDARTCDERGRTTYGEQVVRGCGVQSARCSQCFLLPLEESAYNVPGCVGVTARPEDGPTTRERPAASSPGLHLADLIADVGRVTVP